MPKLPLFAETFWRHSLVAQEEFAERRDVGKIQSLGYLHDAEVCRLQQKRRLHSQELVYVVDNRASGNLTHYAREIDLRYVEFGCIECYVVMP